MEMLAIFSLQVYYVHISIIPTYVCINHVLAKQKQFTYNGTHTLSQCPSFPVPTVLVASPRSVTVAS